ncbi:Hypothetical Protein FCC1311_057092 [Hondaea fermentalgiana]|uniref:DUF389 domain-containing protein n=1 Tax=Hondaea fermentalgiana TaxID=2315210 RepID=A0A2R5GID2_9STRA|nr:Hypothetical Protein FCC1311_057092 [Hondaea fermentalgiana]|eukprot:GBG29488.1 Hypothetical Protein FCC1311_057092 [Hondaea fermentalgiana]
MATSLVFVSVPVLARRKAREAESAETAPGAKAAAENSGAGSSSSSAKRVSLPTSRKRRSSLTSAAAPALPATVEAPAKASEVSLVNEDGGGSEDEAPSQLKNVANEVRDFLRVNASELNFIAEVPFLNGATRWALFLFLCKTESAEQMLVRLNNRGVGNVKDGLGMVLFSPIQLSRISTTLSPKDPKAQPPTATATATAAAAAAAAASSTSAASASVPTSASTNSLVGMATSEQAPGKSSQDPAGPTKKSEIGTANAGPRPGATGAGAAATAATKVQTNQGQAAGAGSKVDRPPSPSFHIAPTSSENVGVANALRAAVQAGFISPSELEGSQVRGIVTQRQDTDTGASTGGLSNASQTPRTPADPLPLSPGDETASSMSSTSSGDEEDMAEKVANEANLQNGPAEEEGAVPTAIPEDQRKAQDGPQAQPELFEEDEVYESDSESPDDVIVVEPRATAKNHLESIINRFGETIKSRVAVDSVVELVNASSEFSFDYVVLVVVASALACIGLVTNNVVIIVASMLVSPLMGPILGVTFGWTLWDWHMIRTGLFSELAGLLLCILVGFIGGLCAIPFAQESLPTEEMWSRAYGTAVLVGISIAIPSGVGVALSVLGNNTSSLVGVAISASLLPPAVNTGTLLAMAILANTKYLDLEKIEINTLIGENNTDWEAVTMHTILAGAGWSLLLTLANIACIWVAGILMFKLKEVVPLDHKSAFWTDDVPNTRAYNGVLRRNDPEATELRKRVADYLKRQDSEIPNSNSLGPTATLQAFRAQPHRRNVFDEDFFRPEGASPTVPHTPLSPGRSHRTVPHVRFATIGRSARHLLHRRSPSTGSRDRASSAHLRALAEDQFDLEESAMDEPRAHSALHKTMASAPAIDVHGDRDGDL